MVTIFIKIFSFLEHYADKSLFHNSFFKPLFRIFFLDIFKNVQNAKKFHNILRKSSEVQNSNIAI
jgi:hypothetical protein